MTGSSMFFGSKSSDNSTRERDGHRDLRAVRPSAFTDRCQLALALSWGAEQVLYAIGHGLV
jgi:hypothetical protein